MNKTKFGLTVFGVVLMLSGACGEKPAAMAQTQAKTQTETQTNAGVEKSSAKSAVKIKVGADVDPNKANAGAVDNEAAKRALLKAYPDFITKIDGNTVCFKDGSTLPFDDGKVKDFNTLLDDGDIQDMFFIPYSSAETPKYLADAGRSRSEALYKKMYGNSSSAVSKTLVNVPWFGQTVRFTKNNGGAEALKAVAAELAKYPELKKYLASSGTFYWRPVRGAKRMSAHSYGIAFDIAVPYSNYWQWDTKQKDELRQFKYNNRIPKKIVEIFEKHGFIWGGAWYHYDTMHFEYRPELINYANDVLK